MARTKMRAVKAAKAAAGEDGRDADAAPAKPATRRMTADSPKDKRYIAAAWKQAKATDRVPRKKLVLVRAGPRASAPACP